MRRLLLSGLLIAVWLLWISPQPTRAHGYLVRSIPQDRSAVSRSPTRVQIWFSEGLEPRFSSLTVSNQAGQRVDLGDGRVVPGSRAQLAVRLPSNLPDGAYIATMRVAFTSDGHVSTDTLVFWVGQQTSGVAASGANGETYLLEVIARALVISGLVITFGGLLLYRLVLYPAWRNPAYRAGGLAPRIMNGLYELLAVGIGAALIGNVIWLAQQSMALFAANINRVLAERLWSVVLNGTQFGDILRLRVVLLIAIAGTVYAARRLAVIRPALIFTLLSISAVIAGAALGTLSISGHAPGATLWPLLTITVDWLHLAANAAWVGGLIALVWLLRPALEPLDADGRRLALLAVLRRFSPLAVGCVALLITTGIYSAFVHVYTPDQLVDTGYGRTLLAKLILIAPLLLLGFLHHSALEPGRYRSASNWLPRSLRAEAALGVSVVLCVALLTATPPPIPPNARASAVLSTYTATQDDLSLTLAPNPGAVGTNSYDVHLTHAGKPLDNAHVLMQFVYPALGRRAAPLVLDAAGDGLYVGAGAELTRAGDWQVLFDVTPPENSALAVRLALNWNVPAQVEQTTGRQAGLLNWLSVAGIVIVLALLIVPPVRRRIRTLDLDPQGVVIGVGALILTLIVLIGGAFYVTASARAFEDAANIVPVHINNVLPDAASLGRGRAVFQSDCEMCHQQLAQLAEYVSSRSDSDLYQFLLGTPTHPQGGTLSEAERWSVINYLRATVPTVAR